MKNPGEDLAMAAPSLNQQVVARTDQIRTQLERLPVADPLRTWFEFELNQLGKTSQNPVGSVHEDNARMRGLGQLAHLVSKHLFQLQYSESAALGDEHEDSILTIQLRLPSSVFDSACDLRFSIEPALLHESNRENHTFDPVTPTAKIVSFLRAMDSSLKFIDEPALLFEGEQLLKELGIIEQESRVAMTVLFQSRYHALNIAIAETGVAQIVEFASGISPRGLQWSRLSPGTIYVESDLPQLMIRKAKLIRNSLLANAQPLRGFLHCSAVDVLKDQSLFEPLSGVDTSKPFVIVTEGLLLYFDEAELRRFFQNMRDVLSEFSNAVWLTDLVSRQNLDELQSCRANVASAVKKVFSLTGRKVIQSNPFQTDDCIVRWLDEFGLRVESTLPLSSATSLLDLEPSVSLSQREQIVGTRKIWRIVPSNRGH